MKKKLTNFIKEISLRDISNDLASLCSVDIPTDTVVYLGKKIIGEKAKKFDLSPPKLIGGNLVIGDLFKAKYVLTAHLDEISFGGEEEINNKLIQTTSPKSVVNLTFLLCTVGQRRSNILKLIKDD